MSPAPYHPVLDQPWAMATLGTAMRLHQGHVDKAGAPYWTHLARTASKLATRWPDATRHQVEAALLHDTLKDKRRGQDHLRAEKVRPRVVQIVSDLTRPPKTPYLDWIGDIADVGDADLIRVKLSDIADNMDPGRPDFPDRLDLLRTRYLPAARILEVALANARAA